MCPQGLRLSTHTVLGKHAPCDWVCVCVFCSPRSKRNRKTDRDADEHTGLIVFSRDGNLKLYSDKQTAT